MPAMSSQTDVPLTNGVVTPDSGEHDPCLTTHDEQQQRNSYDTDSARKVPPGDETRLERYEGWMKERSGLSRKGLVIATCVVILLVFSLIVVIVLAACWPRTPHEWEYPVCRSAECLDSSRQMVSMMNASSDPCADFWRYSCGGWLDGHRQPPPDRSRWSPGDEEAFAHRERVRAMITTLPHTLDYADVGWKLKHFYESCLSLEYIDTDKDRPLRRIITELGGWNVLREFSVLNWDYKRALEQLHSQHGVTPFFQVSVVPDARFPDSQDRRNVIQISPSGLGFPDRSYYYRHPDSRLIASYKRYLKDAVQALGATSVDAGTFSAEIFHFEKRVAEITPAREELEDPIDTYNPKTLSELKIIAPSIPLHEILVAKFPKARIDDSTKIIITSPSYLGNISLIISTTDRGSLNNYLMWQLTHSYLPYLSKEYQDIVSYHRTETTGVRTSVPRWEFCVSTLERFMGGAVSILLERSTAQTMRERASDETNRAFEGVRSLVEMSVKQATWLSEQIKDQAMDKIITLGLQVGYPPDHLTDAYLHERYASLPVKRSDLFTNVGYGIGFLQSSAAKRLTGSAQNGWMDKMAEDGGVFYDAAEHKVVVPMSRALRTQLPLPRLYGSLGVELSLAIASSILPPDVLYKPRGDLLPPQDPAVPQAARSTLRSTMCLAQDGARDNLTALHTNNQTALHLLKMVVAVKHAAKTLAASNSAHVHQPALESLENDALFYVAFAQGTCAVSTAERDDLDYTVNTHLFGKALLQATLRQLPHFRTTFSCSLQSPYVVDKPCAEVL